MSKLDDLRRDMHAMVFNYFYDGWKYRVQSEGYDAVAKDCNEIAKRLVSDFENEVKKIQEL